MAHHGIFHKLLEYILDLRIQETLDQYSLLYYNEAWSILSHSIENTQVFSEV